MTRGRFKGQDRGELTRVFVYGTLLSGEANHRFLAAARRLGRARTAPCFELVDLGSYPALVPGGALSVAGELYAVDAVALAAIDDFEDHPHLYLRTEIPLDDRTAAHAYLLARAQLARGKPRILSGDWRHRAQTG